MLITIILAAVLSTGVSIDTGSKKLQPQVIALTKDGGVSKESVVQAQRKELQDRVTASFAQASNGADFNLKFFWAQKVVSETADAVIVKVLFDDKEACMMFIRRGSEWVALPDNFIP